MAKTTWGNPSRVRNWIEAKTTASKEVGESTGEGTETKTAASKEVGESTEKARKPKTAASNTANDGVGSRVSRRRKGLGPEASEVEMGKVADVDATVDTSVGARVKRRRNGNQTVMEVPIDVEDIVGARVRRKRTLPDGEASGSKLTKRKGPIEVDETEDADTVVERTEENINEGEASSSKLTEVPIDVEEPEIDEEDDCEVVEDVDAEEANDAEEEEDDPFLAQEIKDLSEYFGWEESEDGDEDGQRESEIDDDSGDDCWDEEAIPDPYSSDEEEEPRQRELQDPEAELVLGRTFTSADDFKITMLRYSLKTKYNIRFYKSTSLKLGVKCASEVKENKEPCPWRVYCSYERRKRKLMVKVLVNTHTCLPCGYSKLLRRGTIAYLWTDRLRLNPKITKKEMAAEILREYSFRVSDDACGKAKTLVLRQFKKTHEEHFAKIWGYQAEVLRGNPGTTMEIETVPGPTIGSIQRFYRVFICFAAQRESWKKSCRPIIGLDGAFLRWDIKGQLLAAVGRDGDNRIIPIAWAVVEIENETNWDWFVRHLSRELGLSDGRDITMISDKQKGLVKAIHTILPLAEHRQCCRHILDNWKKDSHDMKLQRLFWKIARSYHEGDYIFHLNELKTYSPAAYESLLLTQPQTWSRAFFRLGSLCNDNLNNLCESFNRTIREARRKPLLDLLEDVRRMAMTRNAKRAIIAKRHRTEFTKRAHNEISKMVYWSKDCKRHLAVGNTNEVEHNGVNYCVDMNESTCGCRRWQMTGIPCVHVACVILDMKKTLESFVSPVYSTAKWRETYSMGIQPVQGEPLWPQTNRLPVLPPPSRPWNPGRPKNHARKKSAYEKNSSSTKLSRALRVITCSNCKGEGHNMKTCKSAFVADQPKKPRGRPRTVNFQGQSSQDQEAQGQSSQVQSSQFQMSQQASQPSSWERSSQQEASHNSGWGQNSQQSGWARWFGM